MPEEAIHAPTNVSKARAAATNNGAGYSVYDPVGQKIGIVERVFANPDGEQVYIRVRIGFFGMRAVLIPVQFVETDEKRKNPRTEVGDSCIQLKLNAT
jgi:PRC-barrel domain